MAVLDNADFRAIQVFVKRDDVAWSNMKSWGITKTQWKDAFQSAEDWFVGGFNTAPSNSFKANIESATSSTTNARIKAIGFAWMGWRNRSNP